jgi:hypothetical protein
MPDDVQVAGVTVQIAVQIVRAKNSRNILPAPDMRFLCKLLCKSFTPPALLDLPKSACCRPAKAGGSFMGERGALAP